MLMRDNTVVTMITMILCNNCCASASFGRDLQFVFCSIVAVQLQCFCNEEKISMSREMVPMELTDGLVMTCAKSEATATLEPLQPMAQVPESDPSP